MIFILCILNPDPGITQICPVPPAEVWLREAQHHICAGLHRETEWDGNTEWFAGCSGVSKAVPSFNTLRLAFCWGSFRVSVLLKKIPHNTCPMTIPPLHLLWANSLLRENALSIYHLFTDWFTDWFINLFPDWWPDRFPNTLTNWCLCRFPACLSVCRSNCAMCLCPDKKPVLREAFRVLKVTFTLSGGQPIPQQHAACLT